jgi:hypothetical protein
MYKTWGKSEWQHCGSGSEIRNLFDLGSGMEKFGSGIRDKHPGSETLQNGKSDLDRHQHDPHHCISPMPTA